MPPVTINANNPGQPNPNPVPCNQGDQVINWNLVPDASAFAGTPIVFPNPAPAGYSRWPGTTVSVVGNTATARVNKRLSPGQREKYKYTVILADGTEFDPDIENTGSGPLDEGKGPKPKPRP